MLEEVESRCTQMAIKLVEVNKSKMFSLINPIFNLKAASEFRKYVGILSQIDAQSQVVIPVPDTFNEQDTQRLDMLNQIYDCGRGPLPLDLVNEIRNRLKKDSLPVMGLVVTREIVGDFIKRYPEGMVPSLQIGPYPGIVNVLGYDLELGQHFLVFPNTRAINLEAIKTALPEISDPNEELEIWFTVDAETGFTLHSNWCNEEDFPEGMRFVFN
jgi:hypothetical protein